MLLWKRQELTFKIPVSFQKFLESFFEFFLVEEMPLIYEVFQAIVMEDVERLKYLLSSNKIDLGQPIRGTTALSLAVYKANYPSVSVLVDYGAPLDTRSKDHLQRIEPPLISSIRLGHMEIFLKLLNSGAKLDHEDFYCQTPLWYAVKEQRVSYVEQLLKMGAPITFQCGSQSPLNLVVQFLNYKFRRQLAINLVAAGLQLNLKDCHERSPLMWAVHHADFLFYRLLIEAGASQTAAIRRRELEFPEAWKDDQTKIQWLRTEVQNPSSLTSQCRRAIREHFRSTHNRDVRSLLEKVPLPQALIRYLLLQDAVELATEGAT